MAGLGTISEHGELPPTDSWEDCASHSMDTFPSLPQIVSWGTKQS